MLASVVCEALIYLLRSWLKWCWQHFLTQISALTESCAKQYTSLFMVIQWEIRRMHVYCSTVVSHEKSNFSLLFLEPVVPWWRHWPVGSPCRASGDVSFWSGFFFGGGGVVVWWHLGTFFADRESVAECEISTLYLCTITMLLNPSIGLTSHVHTCHATWFRDMASCVNTGY